MTGELQASEQLGLLRVELVRHDQPLIAEFTELLDLTERVR
jgi:hypothetical protein